ncbi:MAG: DUF3108 domain-containing protein [Acidobacteriaceae bacterium]|nr:DUF3108 domain-containing protein [Acidobacteriaceae bacterium]
MQQSRLRFVCALLLLSGASAFAPGQSPQNPSKFPYPEKLSYRVEWRFITAGDVTVQLSRASAADWQFNMDIESAGLVTRLYKVTDKYKVVTDQKFCGVKSDLDAEEGKRHRIASLSFNPPQKKVLFDERDVLKNTTEKRSLDVPPCTYDIAGALACLRLIDLPLGKSATLPITDGKKLAYGRIEAQARETVVVDGKTYQAVRYEAFLFDNVLYKRKGRLFLWLTDDASRLPVQMRFQLGFPVGTVNVELEKQQPLLGS